MAKLKFTIQEIVTAFLSAAPKKSVFGNYRIEGNFLLYRAQSSENAPRWHNAESFAEAKKEIGEKVKYFDARIVDDTGATVMLEALTYKTENHGFKLQFFETNTIAVKIPGALGQSGEKDLVLVNSETLDLVGRSVAYGNENRNDRLTEIQFLLRGEGCPIIPLSRFLDLDLSTFKVIDSAPASIIGVKEILGNSWRERKEVIANQNFSGALLFEVAGSRFLADLDRRETRQNKIMPFLAVVSAESIEAAYESLKPKKVLEAEKNGRICPRIGNNYFIPCHAPVFEKLTDAERIELLASKTYNLGDETVRYILGGNSPNSDRAEAVLVKIPRPMSVEGAKIKAQTGIKQSGVVMVIGKIDDVSPNGLTSTDLESWHTIERNEAKVYG